MIIFTHPSIHVVFAIFFIVALVYLWLMWGCGGSTESITDGLDQKNRSALSSPQLFWQLDGR